MCIVHSCVELTGVDVLLQDSFALVDALQEQLAAVVSQSTTL